MQKARTQVRIHAHWHAGTAYARFLHANQDCRKAAMRIAKAHDTRAIHETQHGAQVPQQVVPKKARSYAYLRTQVHTHEETGIDRRLNMQACSRQRAAAGGTRTDGRKPTYRHPYADQAARQARKKQGTRHNRLSTHVPSQTYGAQAGEHAGGQACQPAGWQHAGGQQAGRQHAGRRQVGRQHVGREQAGKRAGGRAGAATTRLAPNGVIPKH